MTRSHANPRPVPVGRYRYSKLRWRLLVHALDAAGSVAAAVVRRFHPEQAVDSPERILVVQLDHLGDAVLSTPLLAELRAAYPAASIDVLASPSNHEVFQADPSVDRVWVAERNWFERRPDRWALLSAVWNLGRRLKEARYDLGIDVRGDVLSVLVLALAGVRRRVGWSMGGGAFLLTDVAEWMPGRHEVRSRLALLDRLGLSPDPAARVDVQVADEDRVAVARRLAEAWPRRNTGVRRAELAAAARGALSLAEALSSRGAAADAMNPTRAGQSPPDGPDWLHADRFGPNPPLLAVHIGAGNAAKRWPTGSWRTLAQRFLDDGWRVVVVGGAEDLALSSQLPVHDRLRNWAGSLTVTQTTALLERADLFIGADSGPAHLAASAGTLSVVLFSGTNQPRQWRPWSRHSLTLRHRVPCQPCHQKV
ncbi:MAG: glycosyltransferase family 9 protein, partial [Isosphaeraceae bacterium]